MKEADIKRQIRDVLKAFRIFHWVQWQGPLSKPGVVDILGLLPDGTFFAIDVKGQRARKDTKTYRAQKRFLDNVNENQGIGFFAYCVEDVIDGLKLDRRVSFK